MGLQWHTGNKEFTLDGKKYETQELLEVIEHRGDRIGLGSRNWNNEQQAEVALVFAKCMHEHGIGLPDNLILSHNMEKLIKENLRLLQCQNKDDSDVIPLHAIP